LDSTELEFDWDDDNRRHLKRHHVKPLEFEQVMSADPLYLEYQTENGEERYKVLGRTESGRILVAVWTPREGRVRAITAYGASPALRKAYRQLGLK
jgi:uncharacterized protein